MPLSREHRALLRTIDRWEREFGDKPWLATVVILAGMQQLGMPRDLESVAGLVGELKDFGMITTVDAAEEKLPLGVSGITASGREAANETRKLDRLAVLKLLYDVSGSSTMYNVPRRNVMDALDLHPKDLDVIETYLRDEGLVSGTMGGIDGNIRITHSGVQEVEQAVGGAATEHFTQHLVQIFNAPVTGSQIQTGSVRSQQTALITVSTQATGAITALLERLEELTASLDLSPQTMAELKAEMQTLASQVRSPRPKRGVLQISLTALRDILASATGSAIWTAVQQPEVVALIDAALKAL